MSNAVVSDPNILTVDRLRKELADRNVPLPKYSKKDTLVELYKQHVLVSRAPKTAAGRGFEFSDEDDADVEVSKSRKSLDTMSKRRSLTTRGRDEVIITSSGINISSMTDAELVERLQQQSADVGPVTDTTRNVYEKKLLKLLEGGGQRERMPRSSPLKNRADDLQRKPMTQYSDEEETEEVGEESDHEKSDDDFMESYGHQSDRYNNKDYDDSLTGQKQYTRIEESYDPFHYRKSMESAIRQPLSSYGRTGDFYSSGSQSSGSTTTTRRSQAYSSTEYTLTPRPALRDGLSSLASASQQKTGTEKAKRSGFCFWLLVLLLLIGFIVIVVIIWNMDPAFRNPALLLPKEDAK